MSEETRISPGPFSRIGVGTVLNELYVIDSLIGIGGMGEVYRGHAIETGEQVAIKTIRPEHAQNVDALTLFKREAKALRKLYHDAIVRYFVFTVDKPLGLPYLAMEYVEGEALSDIVRRGPLDFEGLGVLLRRVASGLHAAHELGVIHRDVSPDNIIVPEGDLGRAKIIDFGIARSQLAEATVIGSGFAGKFNYVSPEQLGLHEGSVTAQSDIYSLGLVIAEASIGRALDMGHSHVEVIERRRVVPDLSEADPRIRPLLTAMLQPSPKDRPATMADIAAWVPASAGTSSGLSARRFVPTLAAVLVAGALGAGAWFFWPEMSGEGGAPERPAPAPTSAPPVEPARPAEPPAPGGTVIPPPAAPSEPAIPTPPPAGQEPVRPRVEPAPATRTPPTIEQIASYVRGYRGGPCFFVTPVSVSRREASIDAFGSSPGPFVAFDNEFQRSMGFEPDITLKQVTGPQCPVVELLIRQAGQRSARVPRLSLRADRLRNGEELAGSVDYRADAAVDVVLVDGEGLAYSLSSYLKRSGEQVAFNLRLEGQGGAGEAKPHLVVALASARPLSSLRGVNAVQASQVFRLVQEEATRTGQQVTVAVRYFKLGS